MSAHLTGLSAQHAGASVFHRRGGIVARQGFRPVALLPEGEHDDPPADPPKVDPPIVAPVEPKEDKGFPAETPVAEMTAEQQVAYWKYQARKHENTAKARADYDALRAKAEQFDAIEQAKLTPSEQAVNAAREEGRREAAREANEKAATAILRANLTARGKTADEVDGLLVAFNANAFINGDDVDTDKVAAFANSIAGPVTGGGNGKTWPDMGQGHRGGGKTTGVNAGRDLYAATRGKK